jgi:hypothetical protein
MTRATSTTGRSCVPATASVARPGTQGDRPLADNRAVALTSRPRLRQKIGKKCDGILRTHTCGTFRFGPRLLYIANALAHHHIGLEETDDGIWSVFFNIVLLAKLDERDRILHD